MLVQRVGAANKQHGWQYKSAISLPVVLVLKPHSLEQIRFSCKWQHRQLRLSYLLFNVDEIL